MKVSRRDILCAGACVPPLVCCAHAFGCEPEWLSIKEIEIEGTPGEHRLVHFTDIHYKGDSDYLTGVIASINDVSPDCACLTGDIVEDPQFLEEALDILSAIQCPLFGVPGNHDYSSGISFDRVEQTFRETGGDWLVNQSTELGNLRIIGTGVPRQQPFFINPERCNILLTHYPMTVEELSDERFQLILAGHSHGGQCRIPFLGAPILPHRVGQYDLGMFKTRAGPLYVNPGIGTWLIPVRFFCRPEITVFII